MPSDLHCPRCMAAKLKNWNELTGEEQMLAERLPASVEYPLETRKKHRFCTRCWYEKVEKTTDLA